MTREQAFREWIKAAENHTWGYDDLWNAACDWQKAQDVKICEKVQQTIGEHSESGCHECGYETAAEDCADLIRDQ